VGPSEQSGENSEAGGEERDRVAVFGQEPVRTPPTRRSPLCRSVANPTRHSSLAARRCYTPPVKIAWLSPLSPVRSGIASYSEMLLPELARRVELTAVVEQEEIAGDPGCEIVAYGDFRRRRDEFDAVIAQVGNNLHHEFVWRDAMEHRSIVVLHEIVLHHLVTEMTLARGDANSYIDEIRRNHGAAGEAFARGRARGFDLENANFLFPASGRLASASAAVIVHNRWAAERLAEMEVGTPLHVIDHPFDQLRTAAGSEERNRTRRALGYSDDHRVIGMFGFVTAPKRPEVVMEAFARAWSRRADLRLLIVGDPAPNIDLEELAARFELPPDVWRTTGWTSDEEFDAALVAVDRVVSLRYPSAGESSGAVVRIFGASKPVAVPDYAQFAELPDDAVVKIPMGEGEVAALAAYFQSELDGEAIAAAQQRWHAEHGRPPEVAERYLEVVDRVLTGEVSRPVLRSVARSTLSPQPMLHLERLETASTAGLVSVSMTLRNEGSGILRSLTWGEPAYRLIVKLTRRGAELDSRWVELGRDLHPGETVEVGGHLRASGADEVVLVHGMVGVPLVDDVPFYRQRLDS
jgi:glycosyltransferase involved in cell wall biosynthesis